MNLKDLARPYTVADGVLAGVTFWLLPYKSTLADLVTTQLQQVAPMFEYTRTKTGECTTTEPPDYLKAVEMAVRLKRPIKSDWQTRRLWDILHDAFAIVEPITVALEFPDGALTAEAAALQTYWNSRSEQTLERWQVFRLMLPVEAYNAWWEAYSATRSNPAPAPAELGQAAPPTDPLVESNGEVPMTTTSPS